MIKKIKITALGLILLSGSTYAQSTLNATGGEATINGNTYEYSLGEMTLVSTESGSNIVVTQGLLQPSRAFASNTADVIISQGQLSIYPNPSASIVNMQPQFKQGGNMHIQLLNSAGQVVLKESYKLSEGNEKQQFDISAFAIGNYILQVNYNNSRNAYKIQKIQ